MTVTLKANRKNKWHTEQVFFSDLKDGNQCFYMVDPLSVEAPNFAQPMYPATHPQEPDTIVWVMAEAWLVDRLCRMPQVKKPERDPEAGIHSAVSNIINSRNSDWF